MNQPETTAVAEAREALEEFGFEFYNPQAGDAFGAAIGAFEAAVRASVRGEDESWFEVAVAEWEGGARELLAYAGWDAFKEAFYRGWQARRDGVASAGQASREPTDESRN